MSLSTNNSSSSYDNANNIYYFWKKDIWKIDTSVISNKKIKNIFSQLGKYTKELEENLPIYNINQNFDVTIIDNKNIIKKKIKKIKKENLTFLKTHADAIYEYHIKTLSIYKNKTFLWESTKSIESIESIEIWRVASFKIL